LTTTIAITNQKGGVGKTTTAIALAHGLARAGRSTVLVDMDAQGNAAASLGHKPSPGAYRLLTREMPAANLCIEVRPDFYLLPGDPLTAELKQLLAAEPVTLLRWLLSELAVDYIIIDTGPSRDLLHALVYHAADRLVIPTTLDFLGLVGVTQQFESIAGMRRNGHQLEVTAILPTFWDAVTTESDLNLRTLIETFGPLVAPAIPRMTRLREAPARGLTPWEILPDGKLAGYRTLIDRLTA